MSPAREVAYDAFVRVLYKGESPDEVVEQLYAKQAKPLKRVDRNLVKEILYGSLRWHSKILWILQKTSTRDLNKVEPEIRAALICGTYQIFYMDRIPDRAAVNESCEYVRARGHAGAVAFINGILRKIARRAEYFAKPDKVKDSVEYLALQFAHPKWIVHRWSEHFKFEKLEKMLAANNQPPPWTVRINTRKTATQDILTLQQALLKDERTHSDRRPLRTALHLKEAPNLDAGSLFQQGFYTIQDEASQLIAYLVDPREGERVVEAAAGPGGKLSHMFELAEGKARLIAIEKSPRQLERGRETLQRLGHEGVEWVQADFLEWKPKGKGKAAEIDKILLDAPCSGLGVLRRHPEGKWQKDPALISAMTKLQRQLIEHALEILKVGGELIYSVCSFEPEESVKHVAWIREKHGDTIELLSPVSRLPDYYKRYVTRENLLMVYAGNQDDMDGFGAFVLKKVR